MLILAIPKSASTSLLSSLGRLYGLPATQEFFSERPVPEGYSVVWRYHSDMRTISVDQVRRWSEPGRIFKQHILPTVENRELLSGVSKVLLLREPEEIVKAYRRAEIAKLHEPRPEFSGCNSEEEWLLRAQECGLIADLHKWAQDWLDDPSPKLVVRHAELVSNPEAVIRAIANFWSLPPVQGSIVLDRVRYSRDFQGGILRRRIKKLVRMPAKAREISRNLLTFSFRSSGVGTDS